MHRKSPAWKLLAQNVRSMIYPRNRSLSNSSNSSFRNDFLNPHQREDLKRRLLNRHKKTLKGIEESKLTSHINEFFQKNHRLNADNLKTLEEELRKLGHSAASGYDIPLTKTTPNMQHSLHELQPILTESMTPAPVVKTERLPPIN